ncbi:hypothetical protein D3C81_1975390 [compost metagenome]
MSPISRQASAAAIILSRSGAVLIYSGLPPSAFSIRIFSKLTDVAEVLVTAIVPEATCASGTRENSRIDFTGPSELTDKSGSSSSRSLAAA